MAGRKVFNEQDARRCLAAVKSSRVDLGTWARAHGVDGRSLNLWRANLERRGAVRVRAAPPKMVEVVVATATQSGPRAPFVLRIGGVELEVGASFDEGALRRLVGLLKSC
jgi:transposase-like protein